MVLPFLAYSFFKGAEYLSIVPFVVLLLAAALLHKDVAIVVIFLSFLATNRVLFYPGYSAFTVSDLFIPPLIGLVFSTHFRRGVTDFSLPADPVYGAFRRLWHPLVLLFGWSVIGGVVSAVALGEMYVTTILGFIGHFAVLILAVPLFYIYCRENRYLPEMLISLVIFMGVIEVGFAVTQYMGLTVTTSNDLRHITGTFFRHHAMLGNFMVIPIAYAAYRGIVTRTWKGRLLYWSLVALFLFVIILSTSRSILLGLASATPVSLFLFFRLSRKTIGYGLILAVGLILIIELTPLRLILDTTLANTSAGTVLSRSEMGRVLIWKGALDYFLGADVFTKLTGVGIGCYRHIPYRYFLDSGARFASGAHNNYLHVLLETGLVGLTLFLVHFVLIIVTLLSIRGGKVLSRAFVFATLTLLLSGLTQETLWFQSAFGGFWLFYGLNLAIVLSKNSNTRNLGPA